MKRILLLLVPLLTLVGIGCKSPAPEDIQSPPSAFLAQFSLDKVVANVSPPGLNCSDLRAPLIKPELPPPELSPMHSSSPKSVRLSYDQFYAALCEVGRIEQFQGAEFIQSLKSEVERQIQSAGAQVRGSTEFSDNAFKVEYTAEKIQGKLIMFGKKKECHYIVTTLVEESGQ
jgi:hypothetical protein